MVNEVAYSTKLANCFILRQILEQVLAMNSFLIWKKLAEWAKVLSVELNEQRTDPNHFNKLGKSNKLSKCFFAVGKTYSRQHNEEKIYFELLISYQVKTKPSLSSLSYPMKSS